MEANMVNSAVIYRHQHSTMKDRNKDPCDVTVFISVYCRNTEDNSQ